MLYGLFLHSTCLLRGEKENIKENFMEENKEERILVIKIEPTCAFREIHETTAGGFTEVDILCGKNRNIKCDSAQFDKCTTKLSNGLSCQEAIERMAKAICHRFAEGCEECKSCGLSCKDYLETEGYMSDAEAALNALLEVK